MKTPVFFIILLSFCSSAEVYGSKEKVKLTDVTTLTLHQGQWTTSRRTQPVPQLQCIGGTAGCSPKVLPETVQCYNKGHDGIDVQWECKSNLVDGIQFGALDVLCEGYEYPDDPYILKGSCGLEYRLENKGSASSFSSFNHRSQAGTKNKENDSLSMSNIIFFLIVAIFIYALYKTCLTNNQRSPTESDYPDGGGPTPYPSQGYQGSYQGYPSAPPPPPSYTYPDYGDNCGSNRNYYSRFGSQTGRGTGGGGFWTGAATGGILGYLFGNRGANSNQQSGYQAPTSNFGGSSSGGTSSSSSQPSTGYGGTRRR